MTKDDFRFPLGPDPQLALRSIGEPDLETLRIHKNLNRFLFFHQTEISPDEQLIWYRNYETRVDDHMLVLASGPDAIGSIGFRRSPSDIDFYNLMMWSERHQGTGLMTLAFDTLRGLAQELYPSAPIRVRVLESNPAQAWYARRGFESLGRQVVDDRPPFLTLEWRKTPWSAPAPVEQGQAVSSPSAPGISLSNPSPSGTAAPA